MGPVNQTELAAILGLSTRQIRNLETEGLPVRAERNRKLYPLPDAVLWWKSREVARALDGLEVTEFDEARVRLLSARADRVERENRLQACELVPIDELEMLVRESLDQVNTALRRAPARHGAHWARKLGVPEREARELIATLVEDIRAVLRSDELRELWAE